MFEMESSESINKSVNVLGISAIVTGLENSSIDFHVEPIITPEFCEPIVQEANHTVLYDLSTLNRETPPKPYEEQNLNQQLSFVNLPCSRKKIETRNCNFNKSHWPLIIESLWKDFKNICELEKAISKYCSDPSITVGSFKALRKYCDQLDNKKKFFEKTLPAIIELALKLPNLVKTGIPLLKQGLNHSISLSQEQIACLLANAFLCTFHEKRNKESRLSEINFNGLFQSERDRVVEKIKCIVNYFERVTEDMPTGVLTFIRRSTGRDHLPDWSKTNMPISETTLNIMPNGKIEDDACGLLQVNFSNKYIGSKVLGDNCYQEEIRSSMFPELLISRLFTEFLKDNEALVVVGAEQFSNYIGYSDSFKFSGNHCDNTPFDPDTKRRRCFIVAIDALDYSNPSNQYEKKFIKRELNKAYVGFYHPLKDSTPPGVATGNWGCGAFKGDPQLKFLIQLMACTITRRPLHYFTFQNTSLSESLLDIYNYLKDNNMKTLQLWEYMIDYNNCKLEDENLFTFIKRQHNIFKQYKEQDDHEKNSKNFKLDEISTKTKQLKTTPYSHSQKSQTKQTSSSPGFSLGNLENDYSTTYGNKPISTNQTKYVQQNSKQCQNNEVANNKKVIDSYNKQSNSSISSDYSESGKNINYIMKLYEPVTNNKLKQTSSLPGFNLGNLENDYSTTYGNKPISTNQTKYVQQNSKECQNNEVANNKKVIDSYNKQSNSSISSDYSESGKNINYIMKLYEPVTNNKLKQTSSLPGFNLGNLENDYSTTYGNKPISTNQTKYVQQNSKQCQNNEVANNKKVIDSYNKQSNSSISSDYSESGKNINYIMKLYEPVTNNKLKQTSSLPGFNLGNLENDYSTTYGNKPISTNQTKYVQQNSKQCQNNEVANNKKVIDSYNKQSNSSISSDYSESGKNINYIMKLYEPVTNNKLKQTSSLPGFNLGNLENDYSTTYGNKPISTNQTKYVQQNSKECQNNEVANNQKEIDSYNKQSNSSISSDYSESGKKIKDFMKLYQPATNNKAKQTSSSPGFSLGNLENDYSTTYGNKPISTNQTKYVEQNSEECQNNEVANNQKVIDSYNKQSNSSISSDYSESGKINYIMKLYEPATNNKAKQTSSSPGFNLGNLENDYSTTYSKVFGQNPF